MKSRNRIIAGMVTMALGGGAYAATFEGRLACDQDPREAATSCMLYVPVTDTVGLPVYTQQISVTYLLEPRGKAAAGMDEAPAPSDISADVETGSFSTEPMGQTRSSSARVSLSATAPTPNPSDLALNGVAAEADPLSPGGPVIQARSSGGIFSWFRGDRESRMSSSATFAEPSSYEVTISSPTEGEPGEVQAQASSSSSRPRLFSWLRGERGSRVSSSATFESSDLALNGVAAEADPLSGGSEVQASSSQSGRGIFSFSWLRGERGSRMSSSASFSSSPTMSEQPAEADALASEPESPASTSAMATFPEPQSSDPLLVTHSIIDPIEPAQN